MLRGLKQFATSTKNAIISGAKFGTVAILTLHYVGGVVICYGPSMEPTLKTKDILLTDHISPRFKRIDVGDVVVARSPADYRSVCKRVVAGPGEIVVYKNKIITVPDDCVWLEGDNKENSNDSRSYGPVPYTHIRRRCLCRLWPSFDKDLDTPSRYHLDSNPSFWKQYNTHIRNKRLEQIGETLKRHEDEPQQSQSQVLLTLPSSLENSKIMKKIEVINDSKKGLVETFIREETEELFPVMKSRSSESIFLLLSTTTA